jgi:hypothetical protein
MLEMLHRFSQKISDRTDTKLPRRIQDRELDAMPEIAEKPIRPFHGHALFLRLHVVILSATTIQTFRFVIAYELSAVQLPPPETELPSESPAAAPPMLRRPVADQRQGTPRQDNQSGLLAAHLQRSTPGNWRNQNHNQRLRRN